MNSSDGVSGVLPLFHVVGFSGHRNLADPVGVAGAVGTALDTLRQEAAGEWIALSSSAAGADLIFVREALARGLGWEASLPLVEDDFARDFTPDEWKEVAALLKRAEHVEVAANAGSREEAYLSGGFEIVNRCDVLLVVWDGHPARGVGGTADVVTYARAMGRPIVIINPETKLIRRENFEHLRVRDENLEFLNAVAGQGGAAVLGARETVATFQRRMDEAATQSSPHFRRLIGMTVWLHVSATMIATAGLAFDWHWAGLPWGKLFLLLAALGVALFMAWPHWQS